MAEETPGNLSGMFGGWVTGRAAGNKRLDASVDRLEEAINKLSDALERSSGNLGGGTRASAPAGSTQAGGRSNGGGASFNGVPTSHAGQPAGMMSNLAGFFGPMGAGGHLGGQRSSGEASLDPRQTGGAHANGGTTSWGQVAQQYGPGAAKAVGYAAAVGTAVYTANHYQNQVIGQTIAAQYAGGRNWSQAYRSGIMNNFSAASDADAFQTANLLGSSSGYRMGSTGYNAQRGIVQGMSATDPTITNMTAAKGSMAMGSVGTFNRMQGMGIQTMGKNGQIDIPNVARQMLARMGSNRVKTADQVFAAFGPAGSATVTVNAFVSQGFIPSEAAPLVLSQMRNILLAQVAGMSYNQYNKNAITAGMDNGKAGKQARENLSNAGIAADTLVNKARVTEGLSRESEGKTIEGFTAGVSGATSALNKFRDALNGILSIPGVGEVTGAVSGATGTMPVLGSILGKIPGGGLMSKGMGMLMGGGGMAPTMSRGGGGDMYSGWGGNAPRRQSHGGSGGDGQRVSSGGSAGLSLSAPRPGINSMSSEQDFGSRTIGQGWHTGVDLEGGVGAPVRAAAPGVVSAAGWGASGDAGYGNVIVIDHGGGWKTMYAHLSSVSKGKGRKVAQGEVIGAVGNTGSYSQGAHLHFEVWRNGKPVDPEPFLRGRKINTPGAGRKGGGSGRSGGSVGGGTSADLGSTGGYSNATSTGGGGLGINYSEVAALALGSSGGAGSGGPSTSASSTAMAGGGSVSGAGGPGGPGSLSLGSYNVLFKTSARETAADFNRILPKVGVLGLQEIQGKAGQVRNLLGKHDFGMYRGGSDTGVAWDKDQYRALQKGFRRLPGESDSNRSIGSSYVLLVDKESGAKFWVVSSHTQRQGYKGGAKGAAMQRQFASLRDLTHDLGKGGIPVFQTGDFNNPYANQVRRGVGLGSSKSLGLDHIAYDPNDARLTGGGSIKRGRTRFNDPTASGGGLNSDHPFLFAHFNIKGQSGGKVSGHGGSPAQNMALGRQMAAKYGWGGDQWNSLKTLWMHESGWRTNADNPTSSAYGIPQALTAMHHLDGTAYMKDPGAQIKWGLNYIKGRYGSPAKAWNFWQRNHWYDQGAWNLSQDHDARVHKGEMILPTKIAEVVRNELAAPGIGDNLGGPQKGRGRGSGASIVFQANAIHVTLSGGTGTVTKRGAEQAGQMIADAIVENARIKSLVEG